MNPTLISQIVKKEAKDQHGNYVNVDVFGFIKNSEFSWCLKNKKPNNEDCYNIELSDEKGNQIFVQAHGPIAMHLRKYVDNLNDNNQVIGFANLEYSYGPKRCNTNLMTYFFTHKSQV